MIGAGTFLQQRYRIDKQIGQGGMGAVYVATDERFGSVVAIKETLCMDDHFRKAIEREARLLNSLKHGALPRVSDHFEENESLFLVMEYIPGDDLSAMLERDGKPFPVDLVLNWADQLLEALDFLHNQDIPVIHRDIKPQNLKLTTRGQIILLDFGLAKGNPTDAGHQTAAKSIFGYSRNYASLEQIQGTGTDPRSDIYSLAATLYHLVTGVPPEDALTRAMSVLSQKPDPLQSANSLLADVPRGFAGVLQRALDLNAAQRPGSASEMRQMLRESENYAYLADPVTVTGSMANSPVFAQETKIMPEPTGVMYDKQTDLKTEVMATNLSEMTSVRSATASISGDIGTPVGFADVPRTRSRRGLAAAALGLLFVGGLVAGGVYLADPSIFGEKPIVANAEPAKATNLVANPDAGETNVANNAANSNSGSDQLEAGTADPEHNPEKDPGVLKPRSDQTEKTADTAKTPKTPTTGRNQTQPDGQEFSFPDDDGNGDIVVKETRNGKTTTTIVREGQPNDRPQRQAPPMRPMPPGFDPNNMTPEQLRKLKNMLKNQQNRQVTRPTNPQN